MHLLYSAPNLTTPYLLRGQCIANRKPEGNFGISINVAKNFLNLYDFSDEKDFLIDSMPVKFVHLKL